MFYPQSYLGGKALKTVEEYFFNTTEQSYAAAWKSLDNRYGHSFKIQEASGTSCQNGLWWETGMQEVHKHMQIS